jgi:hypothetical protein
LVFSLNSLPGLLLIQRRLELGLAGATALALSIATYFVLLDSFISHGWLGVVSIAGTHIGDKAYATLAVLYLLGALFPPCLRWEEAEGA